MTLPLWMCEFPLAVPRRETDVNMEFSHDHMEYLSGVPTGTFSTVYPELMGNVRRAMVTYTESIRHAHLTTPSAPGVPPTAVPGPTVPQLTVRISADGYPMLPEKLLDICDIRAEQERLVKQYLGQHYSESICFSSRESNPISISEMASGGKTSTVPYTTLAAGASQMVPPTCLPTGVTVIPQPRNMNKAYLAKFIIHILSRQGSLPLKEVFQFSHWRTRNGELCPSRYPERDSNNQIIQGTKAPVKRRKPKQKSAPQARQIVGPAMADDQAQSTMAPTTAPTTAQTTQSVFVGTARQQASTMETPQMQVITQAEMTQLTMSGYPTLLPMNGPESGPPQYLVSRDAAEALRQQPTPQASPERRNNERPAPQIDPALLAIENHVPAGRTLRSASKQTGRVAQGTGESGDSQPTNVRPKQKVPRRR